MSAYIFISVINENLNDENSEDLERKLSNEDDTDEFISLFSSENADIEITRSYKINISKIDTLITNFRSLYSLANQNPSLSTPVILLYCDTNQNCQLFGDLKNVYISNIYFNIIPLNDNDNLPEVQLNGIIKSIENSYLYNIHILIHNIENKEIILTCNNDKSNNNYCGLLSGTIINSTLFHIGLINDNNNIIIITSNNNIGLLIGNIEQSNCYGCFINGNNDLSITIQNINSSFSSSTISIGLLVCNSINSNFMYSFINIAIFIVNNNNNNQQFSISLFINKMNGNENKITNCFVLIRSKLIIENVDFSGLIYSNNCNNLNIIESYVEMHGIMINKENTFITSGFIYSSNGKSLTMIDIYMKLYFEENSYDFDYYLFDYVKKSVLNIKNCLFYINRNTVVDISGANSLTTNIENSYYITPNNNTIEGNSIIEIKNINECNELPSGFDLLISNNIDFSTIYNKEMPFFDLSNLQIIDITSTINGNSFLSVDIEFIKLNKILYSNMYGSIYTIDHNIPKMMIFNDSNEIMEIYNMSIMIKYPANSNIIGKIDNCILFDESIDNIFIKYSLLINLSKCIDLKLIEGNNRKYEILISTNYIISFDIFINGNPTPTTPTSTTSETTNSPDVETSSIILKLIINNLTITENNENEINNLLIQSIIILYKENGVELMENNIKIEINTRRRLLLRKQKFDTTNINVIITIENSIFEETIRICNKLSHNNILLYNILLSIKTENENPFKNTEIEINYSIPTTLPTTPTTITPTTPSTTTMIETTANNNNNNDNKDIGEVNSGIVALVVIIVVIVVLIIIIGLLLQIYKKKFQKKRVEKDDEIEKKKKEEKKLKKLMNREKNDVSIEMIRNNPI